MQWLIDSRERLEEYHALARELGVQMRVNVEIDVGLHRGGLPEPEALTPLLEIIRENPEHLSLAGLMGYEPHLSGRAAEDPAVQHTLGSYRGFIDRIREAGIDPATLTLNGAGSNTVAIYERDGTMNDLAAGSAVVKPTDFDTPHLTAHHPAAFIAAPVLKRYDRLAIPGDPWVADLMTWWNPNLAHVHYIYGGYWKARYVSPAGANDSFYHSTNQEPFTTSSAGKLEVGDYAFLRPTQSERVLLQFGDMLAVQNGEIVEHWPVFQEGGMFPSAPTV